MTGGRVERSGEPPELAFTVMAPGLVNDEAPLSFACPRCSSPVTERFYGPCEACRRQLRAEQGSESTGAPEAERTMFEPKMNVVPNHVATKDD